MIHIENITINIQATSAESGPTSALGDALLHAMAESLFAEQTEEELDSKEEVRTPINPARMSSLQQHADAWLALCWVLHEVCPDWCNGPGCAEDKALQAIRAMAEKQASA